MKSTEVALIFAIFPRKNSLIDIDEKIVWAIFCAIDPQTHLVTLVGEQQRSPSKKESINLHLTSVAWLKLHASVSFAS
jgi:hypothetical protein